MLWPSSVGTEEVSIHSAKQGQKALAAEPLVWMSTLLQSSKQLLSIV